MPVDKLPMGTLKLAFVMLGDGVMDILVAWPKPGSVSIKYSALVIFDCEAAEIAQHQHTISASSFCITVIFRFTVIKPVGPMGKLVVAFCAEGYIHSSAAGCCRRIYLVDSRYTWL